MTTTPRNDNASGQAGEGVKADATTTSALYAEHLPIVSNPREWRALMALAARDLSREQMDRTAGASNSPDLMKRCRELLARDENYPVLGGCAR